MQHLQFDIENVDKHLEEKYEPLTGIQDDVLEQYHFSKEFIVYVETLLWATPCWKRVDPHLLQNIFYVYQNQLKRYARVDYKHIGITMKQWLTKFSKTIASHTTPPRLR